MSAASSDSFVDIRNGQLAAAAAPAHQPAAADAVTAHAHHEASLSSPSSVPASLPTEQRYRYRYPLYSTLDPASLTVQNR